MSGNTKTRQFSWDQLVKHADPEHTQNSVVVNEYEFSTPAHQRYEDRTQEGGRRVFKGRYRERGPYAPDNE